MIQLQNVTKRIKENTVLDNVSYTFKSGFVYGLYGQNGSGKTMLLRAISGLINLDSGSIFIDGEKLHDKIEFPPETGYRKHGIAAGMFCKEKSKDACKDKKYS